MSQSPNRLSSSPALRRLFTFAALSLWTLRCGGDPGAVQDELTGMDTMDDTGVPGPSGSNADPSALQPSTGAPSVDGDPGVPSQEPEPTLGSSAVPPTPVPPTPAGTTPGTPTPEVPTPEVPTPVEPAPDNPEPTPVPTPVPTTGVTIDGVCQPLCSDASSDPDGDDWGWENEATCVVPGSATAVGGTACGADVPVTPEPTIPAGDGYLVEDVCLAECATAVSDDDGDGWGWENEATCVVADSSAAEGLERCGEEAPSPDPVEPVEPEPMPSGDVTKPEGVDSTGFFVVDGRLYDKNGNDFVIRGLNHGHYWFRQEMGTAFPAIADTGANSVRIVWETGGTADEMRTVLQQTIDLEMIPMIELHDVTGDESNANLLEMARYYTGSQVKQVLLDYEDYLLVNIANEWSGDDWLGGYEAAITEMRNAGINHTLVIDANGWGQQVDTVLQNGQALLDLDPQHNLLFSVHMYQSFGTESAITAALQGAADRKLPLIVGEFGFQHGTPVTQIPFETILSECARLGLGYMPWSWKGNNSEVSYLDMSSDWAGNSLTDWGRDVIEGMNGITATSQKASLFLLGT